MQKNIILFDMDGTITDARKVIESDMIESLQSILDCGHEIGIISGSDISFVKEQCQPLFENGMYKQIHFWPCNGSEYYKYNLENNSFDLIYFADIREQIGRKKFEDAISLLNKVHCKTIAVLSSLDIPFTTGNIVFRRSTINYCPIGRDFNQDGREIFENHPENLNIRNKIIDEIDTLFSLFKLGGLFEFSLGGKTSIDIRLYNTGKDQVLSKLNKPVWFIGDAIGPAGNDHTIYEALSFFKKRAFKTSGPIETISIVKNILKIISDGGKIY